MEVLFGTEFDDFGDRNNQQEMWAILAALQPQEPHGLYESQEPPQEVYQRAQRAEQDQRDQSDFQSVRGDVSGEQKNRKRVFDDPEQLLFGDIGDIDSDNLPDIPCDIPEMTKTSENAEFFLSVDITCVGQAYLETLKKRFDRVCKKKGWIPSKPKSVKKKAQAPQAVTIKGGQMYINVQGKPSVRIFPSTSGGGGKMNIQGPTREGNIERADEIAKMLRKKWPGSHAQFVGCLTAMYSGRFIDRFGGYIKGLKLAEFNEILRAKLPEHNVTSFFNPEKDNCITVFMTCQDDVKHGYEDKQGQLRLFSTGKVTGFGVKSPKTLSHFWNIVTKILWEHFADVTTEFVAKKQKTGTSRTLPKCSACGNMGHNKRTCTSK